MRFTINTINKIPSIGLIVCVAHGWWLWFGAFFTVLTLVNTIRHAYFKENRAQCVVLEEFKLWGVMTEHNIQDIKRCSQRSS